MTTGAITVRVHKECMTSGQVLTQQQGCGLQIYPHLIGTISNPLG
jgi:hypothetical protein